MAAVRTGRQTPTRALVLPYEQTRGPEAIELYNGTGRQAQEWQELQIFDLMAIENDGLWVHSKYGFSVPRRNGKNEITAIRELWGLLNGEQILHTAHRTTTSHSAWVRLCGFLDALGYIEIARLKKEKQPDKAYRSFKQYGLESIEIYGLPGKISFRTRSSKGGLGEGFDLLVIDEAQEYTDDQESALKYVVSDSQNPQTIFCGTPPTAVSAGTVFPSLREQALIGESVNTGWAEWSIPVYTEEVNDRELWYETNPSLGTILTERKILDEIGKDKVDFNIQRLGVWMTYNQKSAISRAQWDELMVKKLPELRGKLFVGIKFGRDGANVAVSVAARIKDGYFIEAIDCQSTQNGDQWILNFLKKADVEAIVIDGAGKQELLAAEIKDARLRPKVILPTVKEVVVANAAFQQGLDARTIRHMGQPSLVQAVSNCEKRAIGTGGGFGYQSIKEGVEIALLDSVILAHWICSTTKERRKQKARY